MFSTSDIGLSSYLGLKGAILSSLDIDKYGNVVFIYKEDISLLVNEYYSGKANIEPLSYKSELDKNKKLVFGYMRSCRSNVQ